MALLYEAVPKLEDIWVEYLGDLSRLCTVIKHNDFNDQKIWINIACFWYNKAAGKDRTVSRRYHRIATLAQPHLFRQLSYYERSLTCLNSFFEARKSILNLVRPLLEAPAPFAHQVSYPRPPPPIEELFVRAHGMHFTGTQLDQVQQVIDNYLASLNDKLDRATRRWKKLGVLLALTNAAALFEYGSTKARLRLALDQYKMGGDVNNFNKAAKNGEVPLLQSVQPNFRSSV